MQLLTTPLNNLSSQSLVFSRNGYISQEMLLEWFYIILESVAPVCLRCPERLNLCLLLCICASSDPQLQELGVRLLLGNGFLQFQEQYYSIFQKQVFNMPSAQSLYKRAKDQLTSIIMSDSETILINSLFSVNLCKIRVQTWNKLLSGFHPG